MAVCVDEARQNDLSARIDAIRAGIPGTNVVRRSDRDDLPVGNRHGPIGNDGPLVIHRDDRAPADHDVHLFSRHRRLPHQHCDDERKRHRQSCSTHHVEDSIRTAGV